MEYQNSLRIPILPDWNKDSPFYQWANNFVWKNHWRVKYFMGGDQEDLMAECTLMWLQCCRMYGNTINTPQQMMYLYQLWVTGQFHDYSTKDTKLRCTCEELAHLSSIGEIDCNLALKLDKASSDLKRILDIFINAPIEIMEVLKEDTKGWTSKKFFKKVVIYLKIDGGKTPALVKELENLLS